ncbi:MAG: ATP-binding protein [Prevotella sp.]|nr:ATP-binding protein [Prevotella sp.]
MGITLYMDNYRGFNDTLVSLSDVNFLVGENSTGKSTLISLLKTFMSNNFWANANLNCDKEENSTYDEYVNQYSDKRDSFLVGIAGRGRNPFHVLLEYHSGEDGLPEVCGFKSYKDGVSIKVGFSSETTCQIRNEDNPDFRKWIYDVDGYETNDKLMPLIAIRHSFPFIIYLNLMHDAIRKGKVIREINTFELPVDMHTSWIAPIRAKAKSIYSSVDRKFSEDGAHIPIVLKGNKDNELLQKKLVAFGKRSNLFDNIEIDTFGSTQPNAPFAIKVDYDRVKTGICDVGQGVNQLLPILVECYMRRKFIISIQQPEVHLHPKAQAAFGEVIYETSRGPYENVYLIETHSDYTIDRYRYQINQKGEKKKKTKLLFFVRTKTGNVIKPIEIGEKGEYPDKMPKEYGKFFVDEELKKLML